MLHSRRVSGWCCPSHLSAGDRQLTASRGRHLAPLCWGRGSCPRASLPLASLLQGCERGGVCSADAGSWSQFPPRTPPRPAVAAGRWGRLYQHFLGHHCLFLVVSSSSCSEPFVDTGTGSPGAGPGLALSSASGKRDWPENWVSLLSIIAYRQGFGSLSYLVNAGFLFLFSFCSLSPWNVFTY